MAKAAGSAGGSLLKLDAICAKLKNNLETQSDDVQDETPQPEPNNNTQLKPSLPDSPVQEHDDNSPVAIPVTMETYPVPVTMETDLSTSSRKSRRKSQRPRSIAHFTEIEPKVGLVEYELNNPEMDFDSICEAAMEEDEDEEDEHKAFIRYHSDDEVEDTDQRFQSSLSSPEDERKLLIDEDYEALDLTVAQPTPVSERAPAVWEDNVSEGVPEENGVLNLSIAPKKDPPKRPKTGSDEVEMKDYAENTMNELLNMYGLGEDGEQHSISSSMSLKHFSSGSVLNHSPRQHPHAEKIISRRHLLSLADLPGQRSLPRSGGQVEVDMNEDSEDDSIHGAPSNHGDKLGAAYIKAFGDSPLPGDQDVTMGPSGRLVLPDYYKYLKRFNSYEECRNHHCEEVGYKEHYHCIDCSFRVFLKKEEMVRHFKWHKKREESLQQGFMRYSPMDDCGKKYVVCPHNGKQTHYHCIQMGCSKVYISTSDVQMHANYHRKDSAILQEGFQRFRATEDCGTVTCTFHNQRTTHFHCRRPQCSFTFKNKADMEKHKTYHQKDEILARDGFKKFMKYEHCNYGNCRYSKASNHIHCIRPGCNYVLHSTGQLYSHKRKHERRDFENAYKNYRDNKSYRTGMKAPTLASFQGPVMNPGAMATGGIPAGQVLLNQVPGGVVGIPGFPDKDYDMDDLPNMRMNFPPPSALDQSSDESCDEDMMPQRPGPAMPIHADPEQKAMPSTLQKLATKINSGAGMGDSLNLMMPIKQESVDGSLPSPGGASLPSPGGPGLDLGAPSPQNPLSQMTFVPKVSPPVNEKKERDESWKKYLTRYTANDPCHSRCQFLYKDHYHCNSANCGMLFRSKDGVREHAKFHDQQDRITSLTFMTYEDEIPCPEKCPLSAKLHYHCLWADCKHVIAGTDPVFSRMEHYKIHEYSRAAAGRRLPVMPPRPMDTFKRRRGRPPKYPKNEIPLVPKVEMGEEEIAVQARHSAPQHCITSGFKRFSPADPCPDDKCMFFMKEHYHCLRPRCHHATDRFDVLNLHAKDFHSYITIREGFEFFDRTVNCRRPHCHNNRVNRHFHCVRPRCDYSFVRVGTMAQHDKKHKMVEMGLNPISFPVSTKVLLPPKSATLVTNPITIAPINIAPAQNAGIIRAAGTFFPDQKQQKGQGLVQVTSKASIMMTMSQVPTVTSNANKPAPIILTPVNVSSAPQLITIAPKPAPKQNIIISQAPMISVPKPSTIVTASAEAGSSKKNIVPNGNNALPLTMLLQQKASNLMPQTSWVSLLLKMHYNAQQNCGRPFCKLKKKDHYHCFDCTQAFSDPARLKAHVSKHGFSVDKSDFLQGRVMPISEEKLAASVTTVSSNSPDSDEEEHSLNLHPGAFSNILEKGIDQSVTSASSAVHVMDLSKPQVKVEEIQDIQKTNGAEESTVKSDDATEPENEADQSTQQQPDLLECLGLRKASDQTDTKSRRSSRKRVATKHGDFVNSDAALAKVRRTSASSGVHQSMTSARQTPTNSPKQATPPAILNIPSISKVNISIAAKPKTPSPKATNALPKKPAVVAKSPPDVVAPLVINPAQVEVYDDYRKFRFSEDCEFERCAYRQSQTHYHCTLPDCGYAFCDKGRFVQHSERHKRIAELMADEFQQYRANMDCKRPDCEIKTRSTHFHCLKCTFVCMDSSKVTAHRKHHTKMDNMAAQGFQKYSLGEVCPVEKCAHANKHTHYHCTRDDCAQVALGPAQMSAHKVMHDHKDNSK